MDCCCCDMEMTAAEGAVQGGGGAGLLMVTPIWAAFCSKAVADMWEEGEGRWRLLLFGLGFCCWWWWSNHDGNWCGLLDPTLKFSWGCWRRWCGSALSGKLIGKWRGRLFKDDDDDLPVSSAKASQKALWVMKLSLLW